MQKFGIGQSLKRREDRRFVTGAGRYTDDVSHEGALVARAVRSPMAHARITGIDTSEAEAVTGVCLVLTAADLETEGVGPIPCFARLGGGRIENRPVLAGGTVRHVGEAVAFVVAETAAAAEEAAEFVEVDYEPLDAVTDVIAAAGAEAPQLFEAAPENRAFTWECGDEAATEAAFARAAHVTRLEIRNNRVAPTAIEPRAISVLYSKADGFTATLGTQGVAMLQPMFAKLLGEPAERIRLITPDVGGGFGMKTFMYPEYLLAMLAARRLERPVKWAGSRTDSFLGDIHGRDLATQGELAFDGDGRIIGYRIRTKANMGAYCSNFGPAIASVVPQQVVPGAYRIPVLHQHVTGVYSNTQPVDAYRGAGRPEAAYLLERLVGRAAVELGLAPDEIRRRNFISAGEMPFTNAVGATYDSGDFARNMDDAMARADWAGFADRRRESDARGRLRGIGMAYYVECTLGDPSEEIDLRFTEDGRITVAVGTQSNGQGHETAYAQVLGARLGVDPALIEIHQGDTAEKATGGGTGGSRSLQMIGNACVAAAESVIERGTSLMAALYDSPLEAVGFEDGHFHIRDTNRRLSVLDLAAEARAAKGLPEELAGGLDLSASYTKEGATFPNGCHICEVEIDPETGITRVLRYTVIDDFGVVINPMLVAGQVHGGVVQGLGQVLGEDVRYDADGQITTASFMDYVMPKADDFPFIDFGYNEIPCTTNPLGMKGCGEAGTIGACPAAMNAILDALAPLGVVHLDMPATPMAVWQAIETARQRAA